MRNVLIVAAVLSTALMFSNNADAGGIRFSFGGGGYRGYGGGVQFGSSRYNNGYYNSGYGNHGYWHQTGHYDYHPGGFVPHRNHYHYVPGHYDYHDTSHYHHGGSHGYHH